MLAARSRGIVHSPRGIAHSTALFAVVAIAVFMLLPSTFALSSAKPMTSVNLPGNASSASMSVKATCHAGNDPYMLAYDPVNHWMYVPNSNSGNVSVLSRTCHLVGTIDTGGVPTHAAFDPANNEMYVAALTDVVWVVHGLKIAHTISIGQQGVGGQDTALVWDSDAGMMLLAGGGSTSTVYGIQGTTVVGSVGVDSGPQGLCYDPYHHTVLVVSGGYPGSASVTILNAYTPLTSPIVASVPISVPNSDPRTCAYDPANNYDYIDNSYGGDGVWVLYGNNASTVGIVYTGYGNLGIAWDQAALAMYVADYGHVTVIRGLSIVKTITTPDTNYLGGAAYDEENDLMYVTDAANYVYANQVYAISS
jgi:DNA-binding beta-propeller fold protein YncE